MLKELNVFEIDKLFEQCFFGYIYQKHVSCKYTCIAISF